MVSSLGLNKRGVWGGDKREKNMVDLMTYINLYNHDVDINIYIYTYIIYIYVTYVPVEMLEILLMLQKSWRNPEISRSPNHRVGRNNLPSTPIHNRG